MKVSYVINNYTLGAKLRTTQTDKIVSQKRIDRNHTEVVYEFVNDREKAFCDKVLAKKGTIKE